MCESIGGPSVAGSCARPALRKYSLTLVLLITCMIGSIAVTRGLTDLGSSWPVTVTHPWSMLLIFGVAIFVLRGERLARERLLNESVQDQFHCSQPTPATLFGSVGPMGGVWASESLTRVLGWNPADWGSTRRPRR